MILLQFEAAYNSIYIYSLDDLQYSALKWTDCLLLRPVSVLLTTLIIPKMSHEG